MPLLPSFLLLPGPHDVPEGGLALPWNPESDLAVGEYARERGAELPTRLVASAKSWLCHTGVDRTQPILPWDAPEDARRVSPVEAMTQFLRHIRDAWNYEWRRRSCQRLEHQEIYLTVPASFDAVARELTVQAARSAGLENFTLLGRAAGRVLRLARCQQGTGVTSSAWASPSWSAMWAAAPPISASSRWSTRRGRWTAAHRVAVGEHILLGGDNMDLTLAYAVRAKLAQSGTKIDNWQFRTLWHQCRKAKERLLSNPELESEPLVILGRGSSLIGGTIRSELTRTEIEQISGQRLLPRLRARPTTQRSSRVSASARWACPMSRTRRSPTTLLSF
jgi:molecular chaperone DnaK (HSP70)